MSEANEGSPQTTGSAWSQSKPKETGYYWYAHYLPPGDVPRIVHVEMVDGRPMQRTDFGDRADVSDWNSVWAGPIPLPNDKAQILSEANEDSPQTTGSTSLQSGLVICPACGRNGLGYAAHPHFYGWKDYFRASCRYCRKLFAVNQEPNDKAQLRSEAE